MFCYFISPNKVKLLSKDNRGRIKINKKDLFEKLKQLGLYLQVHYIPVHTQPYFQKLGFKTGDYPNAEKYYQQALSLPLHPGLSDRDIKTIVRVIKAACI